MNYRIAAILFMLSWGLFINAQDISVVHLEGRAYTQNTKGEKDQYSKLVFGPLQECEQIVVKENSMVKLIRGNSEMCDLKGENIYDVANLEFVTMESNSIFTKFCDYFHSFFGNHTSSESKSNYQNNIYAISRGVTPAPSLDFPQSGALPADGGPVQFIWTHPCETCTYILKISDYTSREDIISIQTTGRQFSIDSALHVFTPGKKYYWSVAIKDIEMDYNNEIFVIAENGQYQTMINSFEEELEDAQILLSDESKFVYMLSSFEAAEQHNFGSIYGLNQIKKHSENEVITNFFERYWYDALLLK